MLEDLKGQYDINEYQVSQTTLEQIFNNFAKMGEFSNPMKRKNELRRRSSKQVKPITTSSPDQFDLKAQERQDTLGSHHMKINPSVMKVNTNEGSLAS